MTQVVDNTCESAELGVNTGTVACSLELYYCATIVIAPRTICVDVVLHAA